jgi:hypothetical protein
LTVILTNGYPWRALISGNRKFLQCGALVAGLLAL